MRREPNAVIRQGAVKERRARWLRAVFPLLVLLGWTSASPGEPSRFAVVVHAGRVSVTARGAELVDVLAELSRQGWFSMRLDAALEARVARETTTAVLRDLTLEHALRRLLGTANLVFVYARDGLAEVLAYEDRAEVARALNGATGSRGVKPGVPVVEATGLPGVKPGIPVVEGTESPGVKPGIFSQADGPFRDGGDVRPDPARLEAEALTAADPAVRSLALEGLAETGDAALASNTAARVLGQERDEGVLERALTVLSEQESVPLEPLLRFAASHGHPDLRVRALQWLADRGEGDSRVSELLMSLARSDRSSDVRESAKDLLHDLRRDEAAR